MSFIIILPTWFIYLLRDHLIEQLTLLVAKHVSMEFSYSNSHFPTQGSITLSYFDYFILQTYQNSFLKSKWLINNSTESYHPFSSVIMPPIRRSSRKNARQVRLEKDEQWKQFIENDHHEGWSLLFHLAGSFISKFFLRLEIRNIPIKGRAVFSTKSFSKVISNSFFRCMYPTVI